MKIKTTLLLSLRAALGAVFVVSGFQKLTTPYQNFSAVIEKFEILPSAAAAVLAQTLPWAEFVSGVFLVAGFWEPVALAVLWAMNTLFIGVLLSALLRKLPIDSCGCFGEALTLPLPKILSVDIFFWGLFFVYFFARKRSSAIPGLDQAFGTHARR